MPIIQPVIRPPAEAQSFLLQVTTGCSSNTCTFCGAYHEKPFQVKSLNEIMGDIHAGARQFPDTRKVFLMDGDALALSNEQLLPILKALNDAFPRVRRIATYANGYNITSRTDGELAELAQQKMTLMYMGLESGSQVVLDACCKRATAQEMVRAVNRARSAGIKSSVIVLLGLGGKRLSQEHVRETIAALNAMQPQLLSFLSVMLIPGTPLYAAQKAGDFEELNSDELLGEMYAILSGITFNKTIFRSDHASNHIALEGRLPQDRDRLLAEITAVLENQHPKRPEWMRGL